MKTIFSPSGDQSGSTQKIAAGSEFAPPHLGRGTLWRPVPFGLMVQIELW
jgi:hypothetical protein